MPPRQLINGHPTAHHTYLLVNHKVTQQQATLNPGCVFGFGGKRIREGRPTATAVARPLVADGGGGVVVFVGEEGGIACTKDRSPCFRVA